MTHKFADEAQTIVSTPQGNVRLSRFLVEHSDIEGPAPIIEPYEAPPIPPPSVPESVTPWQAREALRIAGLLPAVNAFIKSQGEESAEFIAWEFASRIRRNSPFVEAIAPEFNLTGEQLDALFIQAAGLEL